MRGEPLWVLDEIVIEVHTLQINAHGGAHGIRDVALLQSALARPKNVWHYEQNDRCQTAEDICRLAAAYAFGIISNHPFLDGNKRVALVVSDIFLNENGRRLTALTHDIVTTFLAIAGGKLTEEELSAWFSQNTAVL